MIKYERIPQHIYEKYVSWKSDTAFGRRGWLNRAKRAEDYYYQDVDGTGTNYTSLQYAKIADSTNIPVNINFLHPIINQKLALLAGTKPSIKVVSTDGRAQQPAMVLDKIKHGILYNSHSQIEIENMIKDMLVAGMGHIMVAPSDYYRQGMFNLTLSHIPYDEVILDINAKKRSLEDSEGLFIEKAFTMPKTMKLYGDLISALRDEAGEPVAINSFTSQTWVEGEVTEVADVTTTTWNSDDRIIVREFYEKVFTTKYSIPNPDTGLVDFVFAENLAAEQQVMLAGATDQIEDIYVRKYILLGEWCVWSEVLPITEFPLKTAFFEWGGRPYRSYGMTHFTIGMQEASDKILQIMLLNGILSNNAGWIAPKGSIAEEDRKKWEEHGNNPRVIKEYIPKIYNNEVLIPTREPVAPLSNFYPMVLEMMKSGIEFSTGITAVLQGDAQAGVEVFSSLQQYQNAAMMRIKLATSHINETMRDLGQVMIEYVAATIEPNTYQFFDEEGNFNELDIIADYVNNIRKYKYLVSTIPATAMPTQRLAIATELMKIAQSSPDPSERQILTQKAMQLSDIREYDELMEKLDAVKNANAKLEDLQEAYNRLMETSKQMENQYINISIENRILKKLSSKEAQIEGEFARLEEKLSMAEQMADDKIKGKQDINK